MIELFFAVALCETWVELFFEAGPLQKARLYLIKKTPFLNIDNFGHLFDCKYCASVWCGFLIADLILILSEHHFIILCLFFIVARLSNYAHNIYTIIKEIIINERLKRLK